MLTKEKLVAARLLLAVLGQSLEPPKALLSNVRHGTH